MTNDMDSSLPEGSEGQPNLSPSDGNVQPSSEAVTILKSDWENVQKTLQRLERGTQSEKDRAVKKTNERVDELQSRVDRVLSAMEQFNISKDDALKVVESQDAEAEKDRMLRELYQTVKGGTFPTAGASGSVQASGGKVAEVVKEYGLDENDAEVIDIYRRYSDPNEQEKAALRLAASRARKENPSVSASPTLQGRPNAPAGIEQLTKEYQKNMIAAAGNKARIKELKEAARKAGVPVDSIVFA